MIEYSDDGTHVIDYDTTGVLLNTMDWGAKWDGVTDDSVALTNAFNSVAPGVPIAFELPYGKTAYIGSTIVVTSRLKLYGNSPRPYMAPTLKGAAGIDILTVNMSGCEFEGIVFRGDGGTHGLDSTTQGIVARGNLNSDGLNYDTDMKVSKCGFKYLANGIVFKGRNLDIQDSLFSNSLCGILTSKEATVTDHRGLTILGTRFHSLGGGSVVACCVTLTAGDGLWDVQINDNYFDDCYELIKGFAGPLQIVGNMMSRNYSGIHIDSTGWLDNSSKQRITIANNILHFITTSTIFSGISVFYEKTASASKLSGSISGNDIFNASGHGLSLDCSANAVLNLAVYGNTIEDPGDGGAYDCLNIGAEVGGVAFGPNKLNKGSSTTTGYGLRKLATRTLATDDAMSTFVPQTINGFATANRISLPAGTGARDTLIAGACTVIANELPASSVSNDANISIYLGNNRPIITLTGTLTANRDITTTNGNFLYNASFTIRRTGGGAYTWSLKDGNATVIATLAINEFVTVVLTNTGTYVVTAKGLIT